MAEHEENQQTETIQPGPASPDSGLAAAALALARNRRGAKPDDRLDAFLEKQGQLTDAQRQLVGLQMEHLHEERALHHRHLALKYFGDRLRIGLLLLAIAFGLVVAVGLVSMVWQAHEDHGLVVEAFSVPPDLAQRGLTGQVVGKQVLDKLSEMQVRTESIRAASSYSNNWGDDLKVEIPETGVSLGELSRYLRDRLGHETRISGEVFRTPAGLTITARAGEGAAKSFSGADIDIDGLVQQAAEAVYARTQPYRYSQYLLASGRVSESTAVLQGLTHNPDPRERAWAHRGLGADDLLLNGDAAADAREQRTALRESPAFASPLFDLSVAEFVQGHDQAATRAAESFLAAGRARRLDIAPERMDGIDAIARFYRALIQGDKAEAIRQTPQLLKLLATPGGKFPLSDVAYASALGHDPSSFRLVARLLDAHDPHVSLASGVLALNAGDAAAVSILAQLHDSPPRPGPDFNDPFLPRTATCWLAIAKARFGDLAGARALIETTPTECYLCVRARGIVAAAGGDRREAERWFAEAIRQGPDLPQAFVDRGSAYLAWGDAEGASADARTANKLSPHYADALKLWGDALARLNRWSDARAKYDAALGYAPAWSLLRQARDAAARHVT